MRVKIKMKDLYQLATKHNKRDLSIKIPTESGLVDIQDLVKKTDVNKIKVTFSNGVTRIVADTHRFRCSGAEIYAKDAETVDTIDGSLSIIKKEYVERGDVYDVMIPSPHWYIDQYGIIHHNTGKSLGMCSLAADYLRQGLDVLYISMEMSEQAIAKRIDANLLDVSMDDINQLPLASYESRIKKVSDTVLGKLIIKQYPTASANVDHFNALMRELETKKGFIPKVVIVDYLGICSSRRIKYSDNTYTLVKAISEEMRGFAVEHNVVVWSAAQTNRGAWGASDINMGDTAESAGLPATADLMLGIIETDESIAAGEQIFKQIKSRYADKTKHTMFNLRVDKAKQRWYPSEFNEENQTTDAMIHRAKSGFAKDAPRNLIDFSS